MASTSMYAKNSASMPDMDCTTSTRYDERWYEMQHESERVDRPVLQVQIHSLGMNQKEQEDQVICKVLRLGTK